MATWRQLRWPGFTVAALVSLWPGFLWSADKPQADEHQVSALVVYAAFDVQPAALPELDLQRLDPRPQAVWLWSAASSPSRWQAEADIPLRVEPQTELLTVAIEPKTDRPRADLRLIAAPVAMWQEVPEPLLPAWEFPPAGSLRIPRPGSEPWRLRLVGRRVGSGWIEVPAGRSEIVLGENPAADRQMTLLSAKGEPVAGAVLRLHSRQGSADGRVSAGFRSDDLGRVAISSLPGDLEVSVLLVGGEHAPAFFAGRVSSLPATLTLPAGASLRGRLVDSGRRPVAGAQVSARFFVRRGGPWTTGRATRSGVDGSWQLDGLGAGEAELRVEVDGVAKISRVVSLSPTAGVTDLGLLRVEPGRLLELSIVDQDGRGILGAEVRSTGGRPVFSDGEGLARLHQTAGVPLVLEVLAEGYLPVRRSIPQGAAEVEPIRLQRAFRLTGRLVDEDRSPISEGLLRVELGSRSQEAEVRADGSFALDLPAAAAAVLVASSTGTGELRVDLDPGAAGEVRDLGDLHLPAGYSVTGRVVRAEDGSAIAGATLWSLRSAADPLYAWARGDTLKARSGAEGGFALRGLQTKSALLRIEAANRARRYVEVVLPDEDTTADLGELALEPGCEVTVEAGEDAPQGLIARLDLRGQWLDSDMLTASVVERRARFANVPQGAATVSLMDGSELVCERQIEVPDEPTLTVDCAPGGQRVRGLVRVGGLPIGPGLLVWSRGAERRPGVILKRRSGHLQTDQVLWGGRPDVRVPVDPSGYFDTDQLSAGEWRVTWSAEGGGSGGPQTTLQLSDQPYQEANLSFAETVVRGRVLDLEGAGVARAHVRALGGRGFAISGGEGRFSVAGLAPGPVRLQAQLGDASSEVAELLLAADRAPEAVDLVLIDRPPSVEVRVETEAGGAAGAFVFVDSEGQGIRQLTADHRGRVAVVLHPPLPNRLRAAAWSSGTWIFGSWLPLDRAREGVELMLSQGGGIELACDSACSGLQIFTAEDWELATLSARLGRLLRLSGSEPLVVTGLPPGTYRARAEGGAVSTVVEAGSVARAELP